MNAFGQQNQDAYNKVASAYDEDTIIVPYYRNWYTTIHYILSKIPTVDPLHKVQALDVGCGTGTYADILLEKGYAVTGVDNSQAMLDVAHEKLKPYKDRFTPIQDDILNVRFPPEKFDIVLAVGSIINHLSDWDTYIQNLSCSLKNGGVFIFDIENMMSLDYFFHVLYAQLFRKPGRPSFMSLLRELKKGFTSGMVQGSFLWEVGDETVDLALAYNSSAILEALLKKHGFSIIEQRGTNILSSVLPAVALSVTYRSYRHSQLQEVLNNVDLRLGKYLYRLAGIRFIIAEKVCS